MSDETASWHPGEIVPASGIYACDCGGEHHWSTDVKGHRFPPLPSGCSGRSWTLQEPTHPENRPG
ncbi:hypothetical protein [Streptomyces sp. EN23]|uniref:hypothetical protein n=1 Tax=Streptomyces sp. EN23 TaxID=212774 RepID=UPI00099FCDF1|nr:hypothetical protein [Streptomyces sp. EN23]